MRVLWVWFHHMEWNPSTASLYLQTISVIYRPDEPERIWIVYIGIPVIFHIVRYCVEANTLNSYGYPLTSVIYECIQQLVGLFECAGYYNILLISRMDLTYSLDLFLIWIYRKTSNISHTLVSNKIVDHSLSFTFIPVTKINHIPAQRSWNEVYWFTMFVRLSGRPSLRLFVDGIVPALLMHIFAILSLHSNLNSMGKLSPSRWYVSTCSLTWVTYVLKPNRCNLTSSLYTCLTIPSLAIWWRRLI